MNCKLKWFLFFSLLHFSAFADVTEIPNFTLPVFEQGSKFQLSEHLAKKPIVMNFFASWCTSCIDELPELNALKQRYRDKFNFVAVNAGERPNIVKKFLSKNAFDYLILWDEERAVSKSLGVLQLPVTLVIAQDGKIIYRGNRPPKEL